MSFELIIRISLKIFAQRKKFLISYNFYTGLSFVALKCGFLVWIGN